MKRANIIKASLILITINSLLLFGFSHASAKNLVVGLLLAGAGNDQSYNQFHLDAAYKAADNLKNIKVIYINHANPISRSAEVTIPAMVDDLVQKGATVIIANTYEMELGITAAAPHYPQVMFIQINGDEALKQSAQPNIINVVLMFEYAQMLAGFSAGMTTASGKIAYLGGSPNSESYRQISAAYLGAKYAWEKVRGMPSKDFRFRLKWMGNWFDNLSPQENTRVSTIKLFNEGSDVIMGGNYSTDIITAAQEMNDNNKKLLVTAAANPYMAQNSAPFVVGLSYYDWLPVYEDLLGKAQQNQLASSWIKPTPDMASLNKFGVSNVGFVPYDALDISGKNELNKFVKALADGSLNLFQGPLKYKDGSVFVEEGQTPTPNAIHNMSQLLEGIEEIPYMPNHPARDADL